MWNKARRCAAASSLLLALPRAAERAAFPHADRDVAPIVGGTFSTEDARDRAGEAEEVMQLAGVKPGMSVADVGAGRRLLHGPAGAGGRAEGPGAGRGYRARGPRCAQRPCPARAAGQCRGQTRHRRQSHAAVTSFDRVFLVHMYHEVQSPYAFLWHMREGVKQGGLVVVVDANRPVKQHGMPPDSSSANSRRLV